MPETSSVNTVEAELNNYIALKMINIPAQPQSGIDIVTNISRTGIGRLYKSHLKQYPAIRSLVIWAWKNLYPVYARYLVNSKSRRWLNLIRFSDYVEKNGCHVHTLIESCTFNVPSPKVFPISDQSLFETLSDHYTFPEVRVAVLHDAIQYGETNLVLAAGEVICHDLYDFRRDFTSEELHGRTVIDAERNRIRWLINDEAPESIPAAATFVDACACNYAHWMTEVLPRIILFCADDRFKRIPIIVNDGLHKNILESLFLAVGGERKIFTLPLGRALVVKELYLTSVAGYVPFDCRDSKLTGHSHGFFSPDALKQLRHYLTQQIPEKGSNSSPEKIYLRRKSGTRKITNASEIEQLLTQYGFVIVEPERLTFAQQVQLFRKAKMIIGPTGAAFANAIFCQPGAQVIVLMGKNKNMIYRYWSNMLAPIGVRVDYVLGDIVENKHLGIHGDFEVATDNVVDLLTATGSPKRYIHPSAQISPHAQIGNGVEIGPFSIIHGNVILGNRVKVGAYCELGIPTPLGDGSPLIIGDDALIRSHSVFYESSSFGANLITGHRVTVRENTIAGRGFQIGTLSEIQGDCCIGDYVRFQSNVFVGKQTTIGNYVWVLPYVILTNDPTPPSDNLVGCKIEDFASISAASVILPGVTVGHHSLVAAKACVTKDVPPNMVVMGIPARVVGDTREVKLRDGSDQPAYPWTRHFTRGYPDHVVAAWASNTEEKK